MPQLNFAVPPDLLARIDSAKPNFLDRKGFLCLLLTHALDASEGYGYGLGKGGRGVGAYVTEVIENPEPEQPKSKQPKNINKSIYICDDLKKYEDLILEFWRVKKGSKGDTAWKLLITELQKLQAKHGDAVVQEQLQLAINGKWAGVRLAAYEQFKAPRGGPAMQPEVRHPASREFRNGRFVDEGAGTSNAALAGLF